MDEQYVRSAAHARQQIDDGVHDRLAFREALLAVPLHSRDAWLDRVLGLRDAPADGPDLPRGCVPYLPCSVDALLEIVDRAAIGETDVFVDVGSGVGRAMAFVHLLTGATVIGIEIQPDLVRAARDLAPLLSSRMSNVEGDAALLTGYMMVGTVFFLYCPFSDERLRNVLDDLETIARSREIRVCTVDLPLPDCNWLMQEPTSLARVAIYRSV